jgi:Glycosyl hydrolases family 38 N-terminal domain/Alpha mannosidase middle domain
VTVADPNPTPDTPLRVYVVPHTHWDREWYHVAPRFRQRLVALVDAVLATPSGPFLLDGQAITLRDYLDVRPDREPELRAALRDGTLEAGPWFVLADNLIPSAEAIVRNLEAGARVLHRLGVTSPAVAYCPDSFGHPAAMPTIAAGFGFPVAIVWRGMGGATHPRSGAFLWEARDGSTVLAHHLPPDGYEFGSALPTELSEATERWARLLPQLTSPLGLHVALLLNGADHHARQSALPQALAALQHAAAGHASIQTSTLAMWRDAFVAAAASRAEPLPRVLGELRDSYGYTWTLAGTVGTRAHQKRRNALLERGLLRDVEPWMALARLHARTATADDNARLTMHQLPALLHRAWEDLLATHPHDTLCGCSIDAVARSMDSQQELVAEQGKGLREAALQEVVGYDAVSARAATTFDWQRLVLRNRAPRARGGVAVVRLLETLGDVPVGPGSGAFPALAQGSLELNTGAVLSQAVHSKDGFVRRESPQHYPDNDLVRMHTTLLWVPPVPAMGVQSWSPAAWAQPSAPPVAITVHREPTRLVVNNGRLSLSLSHERPDPLLSLRVDDRALSNLLSLRVQHDEGDSYTPALRGPEETLRCTRARLVMAGPLRATIRLWWRTASGIRREGTQGRIEAVTDVCIDAMSPVVVCHVRGRSWRTNHRLQLVWHTDVQQADVWADAAFGPLRRRAIVAPAHATETVPSTMPMHRWVMQVNPMFGATMVADGLAEAEPQDHRLALTLVRGIGDVSKATLPERPGHAGWPAPIPDAQCVGPFRARSALYLHGPLSDDTLARVRDVCDEVLLPLVGESWRDLNRSGSWGGPEVVGEAYELSACTISAHVPDAVLIRVVNNTARAAWGTVRLPHAGPWDVTRCRLDETPLNAAQRCDGAYTFEGRPGEVITLRVRRAE